MPIDHAIDAAETVADPGALEPERPPEAAPKRGSNGAISGRSMVRRPGKGAVTVRVGKWGMGMPETCRVLEVSESGVMFRRRLPMEIGAELEVDMSPHHADRSFRRVAFVRRVLPMGDDFWIGCEFESRAAMSLFAHLVK